MTSIREAYSPERLDQVRELLEMQLQRNLPVTYEIFIDNFRVVPKTSDIGDFDTHERFIKPGTRNLKLIVHDNSTGNEQVSEYMYRMSQYLSGRNQSQELSGVELEEKISSQVTSRIERFESERELHDTRKELENANRQIRSLEKQLEEEKGRGVLETGRWGQLTSVVLEGIIRRNPRLLSVFPGGEELAGVFMQPPALDAAPANTPEAEMSFKEKTAPQMSQQEQVYHAIFKAFDLRFNAEALTKVNTILHAMLDEPELVDELLSYINSSQETGDTQTTPNDLP